MNDNYNNPVQFEFFSGNTKNSPNNKNFGKVFKCLTLSFENIIVLCIIFVMSLVLTFSFGVEKGKKVVVPAGAQSEEIARVVALQAEGVPMPVEPMVPAPVIQVETELELPEVAAAAVVENSVAVNTDEDFFTIQVASFKLEKNAQLEADKLKKDVGCDIFIIAKGDYSIVCVGKFIERTKAIEFSGKLKNRYNDCLVRRL